LSGGSSGYLSGGGRTPSFSQPAGGRGGATLGRRGNIGNRPTQLPAGGQNLGSGSWQRPSGGDRLAGGTRPSTLPSNRPDIANGPGIGNRPSTLPSTRPDLGGRSGTVGRGLAGVGAGAAIGAGLANRAGEGGRRTPEQRRNALGDQLAGGERPGQLPARDWGQVRQDWSNRRDEIREDWQQHRDHARDDWQNWFQDHYGWYGGWYAGYAPGYWTNWDYLWDHYPVAAAMGLTWWGANSVGYEYGYGDYSNPYYVESMPAYYAEPVEALPAEPGEGPAAALPPGVSPGAVARFDEARAAFLRGQYEDALKLTDAALAEMAHDAVLHEFRSLVLFALKRYGESAAAIHPVLAVGPGWDWKTLASLYPDVDTYTSQLRALEAARKANPTAADSRFLLGYHYLTCGYADDAMAEFSQASKLRPMDSVSASLAATLSPRNAEAAAAPAAAPPKPVPADDIAGDWTVQGKGSTKYDLKLQKDGTFTWSFTKRSRPETVKGVYTIEGNILAMEPDTGGIFLAELTPNESDTVHFKQIGAAPGDQGLEFHRVSSRKSEGGGA
jgi:tetratricopeptide (TPR) repeat protein